MLINDVNICIATKNGSGSASANNILFKAIFKMGITCSSKNMFPSNIQGMPTWYEVRASKDGFKARKDVIDVMLTFNLETAVADLEKPKPNGLFIYDSDEFKEEWLTRNDLSYIGIPASTLSKSLPNAKIRPKLRNVIYVGALAALFGINKNTLTAVLEDTFGNKPDLIATNLLAIETGYNWVIENNISQNIAKLEEIPGGNEGLIISNGNFASAIGAIYGGVSVVAWYPITPSSSIAETLEKYLPKMRTDKDGKATYAILQAEDEIAAAGIITGAGWAGARALTPTSGPGLSLMTEIIGLAYFTEIPSSYFIVQRGGPSTGLPTRTQQADIFSMYFASHGDTKHVVLLPHNLETCFEFAKLTLDLADQLQTPVFFASDLDLGMNLRPAKPFKLDNKSLNRGKLLSSDDIKAQGNQFKRYFDIDGDGIPQRTIPGNLHPKATYFCSGAAHTPEARRTEDPIIYQELLTRLKRKHDTARNLVPQPIIEVNEKAKIGIICFGSSVEAVREARVRLKEQNLETAHLLLQALPLSESVFDFVKQHEYSLIVEQNRDAQVATIFKMDRPDLANKIISILNFDGLPITAGTIFKLALEQLRERL